MARVAQLEEFDESLYYVGGGETDAPSSWRILSKFRNYLSYG